jgi:hypothetical protein
MRRRVLLATIILVNSLSPLAASTHTDALVEELDRIANSPFDHWKMSTSFGALDDDVRRYSDPGFDDALWKDLAFGERVFVDSCWLRREVALPEFIAGHPVSGTIDILLTVDDYGYLWVNGEERGHFPWDGAFQRRGPCAEVALQRAVDAGTASEARVHRREKAQCPVA